MIAKGWQAQSHSRLSPTMLHISGILRWYSCAFFVWFVLLDPFSRLSKNNWDVWRFVKSRKHKLFENSVWVSYDADLTQGSASNRVLGLHCDFIASTIFEKLHCIAPKLSVIGLRCIALLAILARLHCDCIALLGISSNRSKCYSTKLSFIANELISRFIV